MSRIGMKLKGVFNTYFQNLFQTSNPSQLQMEACLTSVPQRVTLEMNNQLQLQFTHDEVQEALKQMAPLKSLGPDGYSAYFFQSY